MPRNIGMRAQIALLLYSTLIVVMFTVGIYVVMLTPSLTEHAGFWISLVVAASLVVAVPMAWCGASCLCTDYWRKKMVAEPSPLAKAPTRPI